MWELFNIVKWFYLAGLLIVAVLLGR